MAGLLVYLPGFKGDARDGLAKCGLGDLLEPGINVFDFEGPGPDGGRGVVVTFHNPAFPSPTPREYNGGTQKWMPAPPDGELPAGRYWVGCVKVNKPRPEELQRPNLIDGEPVFLADGKAWVIPIAEYCPKRLTRDPDTGREITVPQDKHQQFVERTNAIYCHMMSEGFRVLVEEQHIVTIPGGLSYAALALSKNYRVNADVLDLLELIGQTEAFEIAKVATGISLIERKLAQKKSLEASSP